MKDIAETDKRLQYDLRQDLENSQCNEINDVSIMVHKKMVKIRKNVNLATYCQLPAVAFRISSSGWNKTRRLLTKHISMTEINKRSKPSNRNTRSSEAIKKKSLINSKFVVNRVSGYHLNEYLNMFNFPTQKKWKVYRCQLSTPEDTCCCSCNSDAMFEVMKSLYDCYKKKNCDNCNCILCSHKLQEERRLGEEKKSLTILETKKKKSRIKKSEKMLEGKTLAEKEEFLKELVKTGKPLPKGKTASDKTLIKKVKTELGVPETKTATTLEKKTKDKASEVMISAEKLKKPVAAGLITPLEGKTPEQQEKIVKGLAMQGLPLPEAKNASEKKLIEKVRGDLGLPPEPKTASMKEKYAKAASAGLLQPLEGKSPQEMERILQGLQDKGIPLPEARTATEKAIIAKVKEESRAPSITPSVKLLKAKSAGLITPIEGKPPEQQEKILKGLAMQGLPLPEGKIASEKKVIEKVRAELGLPPEPKTASMKEKYAKAADAGLLQPLEGKSLKEKERILQGLHDKGIPLPEGRMESERAIIAKIKAGERAPSIIPSTKLREVKPSGLLPPLEGKTPSQKEKLLTGLATEALPLPEVKTASEKKIAEKVRADLGPPPGAKTLSMKEKYVKAASAGLLQPLEVKSMTQKEKIGTPLVAKTPSQKEKTLKELAKEGLPLPEAKTASEKKIAEKVRADLAPPPGAKTPSMKEKDVKAASAGLLQPLEVKSMTQKEKILKSLKDKGITLPEGRTPSVKVKAEDHAPSVLPSEKLRKAKAAGLLTPLEGKTPSQKEQIVKGLAKEGLPLPEVKTASEKKIVEKIRADLGPPPGAKTPSMKEKDVKAASAGLLQPLEVKSLTQKEKILKSLKDKGITLPEGRTPSVKVKEEDRAPSVMPSEKLRKAKAAGLLTPLEGKTSAQKEQIVKGLAKEGLPLPEAKTASEKKIVEKVRADLSPPPGAKTPSMKDKDVKAASAGLLQPLEVKSLTQKEKILKSLKDKGITLPEGRTPSVKVKAEDRAPSVLPSEKLRKAKAAGLLTPLEGKTPSQKEQIVKGLAKEGLPLPEAKSASEKKLSDKVRAELGLPPQPKTASMKEKYEKAASAGLLKPLEGKSLKEKEKILKSLQDKRIPLPEGRTASEKAVIAKVKAVSRVPSDKIKAAEPKIPISAGFGAPSLPPEQRRKLDEKTAKVMKEGKGPVDECICGLLTPESEKEKPKTVKEPSAKPLGLSITSDKLIKAKAAGLLTPVKGKTPTRKESIVKGLPKERISLSEAKTAPEKKLSDKIRAEPGLPPGPKSPSMKEKSLKAASARLLQPLEGKPPKEKEKEKTLISKVKVGERAPSVSPSIELRKAKTEISPLEGKAPSQKEKIVKELVMQGLPLPEGKTASEKKVISKVRADLALPPEPKRTLREPSAKKVALSITSDKLKKAKVAGLLTPLEGKPPEQKEKILKGLVETGLPLPEGKTASDKALIKKVKTELGIPEKSPSEKLRKAKKSGILTPLEGKTTSQKEKILRGRVASGLPLPEGRTSSDKGLIQKIKEDTGYVSPTAAERLKRAKDAGLLTPIEGKTPSVKEKILRDRVAAGVPITEVKTPSEKEIVRKIAAGEPPAVLRPDQLGLAKTPSDTASRKELVVKTKAESKIPSKVTSGKLRKAKEAGLLTPLSGKSSKKKEKILKGLIEQGLPLPESQTASEKKIAEKVRKEIGLPPEPKSLSEKTKMHRAEAAGIVTPLEGKTPTQKEGIVRSMVAAGIPLPEGRTSSEKSMIKKIKAEEKLSVKAASTLLTPMEEKTPSHKAKVIKSRAETGKPLPEGKSPSEKALIQKVRTELGIPPPAKTVSEKELVRKAKEEGLLTPISGKSAKEKERILKGLAEAGLPMPEGKTASEKELVKKVRADTGLPPSEKRAEIKSKSKKIGISPSKRRVKTIAAGISEKFEDIIKTTTCDRGCGCDKKKIKFKHSYVKIRVTSPDISSLCDCPYECIPGVKAGAYIDNEGIKVTIGRVCGATSFTSLFSNHCLETPKNVITLYDKILTGSYSSNTSVDAVETPFENNIDTNDLKKAIFDACPLIRCPMDFDQLNTDLDTSFTSDSYNSNTNDKIYKIESDVSNYLLDSSAYESYNDESDRFVDCSIHIEPSGDIRKSSSFTLQECSVSYDSLQILKSESSLSLNTDSSDFKDLASVLSLSNSSYYALSSTQYLYSPVSNGNFSNSTVEETDCFPNKFYYSENYNSVADTMMSETDGQVSVANYNRAHAGNKNYVPDCEGRKRNDFFTYLLSGTKLDSEQNTKQISDRKTNNEVPFVVISNLDSEHDISNMVDQFLWKYEFSDASSIILVVPTSDDNDSDLSSDCSTICIQLSKHYSNRNQKQCNVEESEMSSRRNSSSTRGLKISAKAKKYCMEGMQETLASFHKKETMFHHRLSNVCSHKLEEKEKTKHKLCQISTPYQNMILYHGVSTDTTSDRPCCCAPNKTHGIHFDKPEHLCVPNTVSNLVTPLLINPGLNCDGYYRLSKKNVSQQVSVMSIDRLPTSVSPCIIPPCHGRPGCHQPEEFLEIPYGTPMPKTPKVVCKPTQSRMADLIAEPTIELKPAPEKKQSEPCQCSPEKMKEIFEQVLKGKPFNLKSTGCDAFAEQPASISGKPQAVELITSDSDDDEDCGKCSHHKYIKGHKMKCSCSGKNRTIKIRPLCPCEQHQPPVSKSTAGPRAGTKSRGCQCCCRDLKTKSGSEKEVLGPAGGVCQMDPGGTYCQAGQRPSTDPKEHVKDCACANGKRGKKNKNIICECPPAEPEPKPELEPNLYESYQWVDEKQILRQKSDMTQTQSGFRILKKKKPPVPPEPEFTVEDAVKYYVAMNPELIKEFCPPPPAPEDSKKSVKKTKNKEVICECPPGSLKFGVPPSAPTPPPVAPADEAPSGGLKFSIGGKGSGSKGLSGVCCFDMIQETNISSIKHVK